MSAQTRYGYSTPKGHAGGIYDLAPYAIDTFINEADTGVMKFGIGVVQGENVGHGINVPKKGATAAKFEGVTTNNRSTEYDLEGNLSVRKGAAVGVMRYGRIYARIADKAEPKPGEAVYLILDGDEAGYFTNVAAPESPDAPTVAIKARFLGGVDTSAKVAVIELFNQAQA